jgi:putative FmdB family regulatory protein
MPFYQYYCAACKESFKTYHGSEERCGACPRCESQDVTKALPQLTLKHNLQDRSTAGTRVEKFIEESRQSLAQQLEETRKEYKQ